MKNTIFLLLLIISTLSCCTRKQSSENDYYQTLVQVVEAAKSAKEENPESVRNALHKLENIFRTLPKEEQQNDSLIWYAQKAFSLYYGLSVNSDEHRASLHVLDSLAAAPTPFLETHAKLELLAIRAYLNLLLGQTDKAIALADSFSLLPIPKDIWRLARYNISAASVYNAANLLPKAIERLEQSVDFYHKGEKLDNMGSTLAWLGVFYNQTGKFEEAAQTNLEAIKYYETHPEDRSTVIAYGEQANLYFSMGMLDKSLEMNAKSIEIAKRNYNNNLGDIYRFRAEMFIEAKQQDSTFYYLREASHILEKMKNPGRTWASKLDKVNACLEYPDSIDKVDPLLAELCADSTSMPDHFKMRLSLCIGKVWMKSGQVKQAVNELEKVARLTEQAEMYSIEEEIRSMLMDGYLQLGENAKLAAGFKRYKYLTDSLNTVETKLMVAGANIRFDTEKKEQENRLLTAEVELKSSKLRNYALIGSSLLTIALCIGAWFWMRQHSLKLRLRLEEQEKELANIQLHEQKEYLKQQEQRLQQIISSRQELNKHNEELLRQLAEIQASHEKTCNLDKVMESLQPRLITIDEEEQFRAAFARLHPSALHRLRSVCPRITHAEELLCMLIILKQTNEEISRTLGISRSSVLQNRYRLKAKLQLPEGIELDSEIIHIATTE